MNKADNACHSAMRERNFLRQQHTVYLHWNLPRSLRAGARSCDNPIHFARSSPSLLYLPRTPEPTLLNRDTMAMVNHSTQIVLCAPPSAHPLRIHNSLQTQPP